MFSFSFLLLIASRIFAKNGNVRFDYWSLPLVRLIFANVETSLRGKEYNLHYKSGQNVLLKSLVIERDAIVPIRVRQVVVHIATERTTKRAIVRITTETSK